MADCLLQLFVQRFDFLCLVCCLVSRLHPLQAHRSSRLVHHVDRLVRELPVVDIAIGKMYCGLEGFRQNLYFMMLFISGNDSL